MKKIIYTILGAALLIGAASCMKIDNFAGPEAQVSGKIIDKTTGEPMLLDHGVNHIRIWEVSYSLDPTPQDLAIKEDGTYQMVLTLRGAYADIFWFSLFHELGHIVNGDVSKVGFFIDSQYSKDEKKETAADLFASHALLDSSSYSSFASIGAFNITAIRRFAQSQGVPPYIVIGRLQKEKRIPWGYYQDYKLKYKWAES